MARLSHRKNTAQVCIADMISFQLHALATPRNMQTGLQFILGSLVNTGVGPAGNIQTEIMEEKSISSSLLPDETDKEDIKRAAF